MTHTRPICCLTLALFAGFNLSLSSCAAQPSDSQSPTTTTTRKSDTQRVERSTLRERALKTITEGALSAEAVVRANSIEGLQSAPSRAEPAARAGLQDENAGVRFAAAMTVGALKLHASAAFVEPLIDDRDPRVRAAAIYALSRLEKSVDLSPLARMLEDPDPRFRSEAARVLGEMGNATAIPMLRSAAAQSTRTGSSVEAEGRYQSERLFQLQVAEALSRLGDEGASDSIRAALYPAGREGFESSALAAQILGNIKDTRAVSQLVDLIEQRAANSKVHEDPRKNTFVQPPEVRLAAARSLAQMGYPGGMYVAEMYERDLSPMLRAQCAFVYAASSRASDLDRLERLLADPSEIVRVSAAAGILRLLERLP